MAFGLLILIVLLNHSCLKGAKVLMTLSAIEMGTGTAAIGVLYAMYSLFPALLSVYAGRLTDRHGFRPPLMLGSSGLCLALLLPYFHASLPMLFVSAIVAGTCYIFYIVTIQHLFGALGQGAQRTRNYGIFAICVSVTAFAGPMAAGFSIDAIGHRHSWPLLAAFPAVPLLAMLLFPALFPQVRLPERPAGRQHPFDLLRNAPLRRVLLATAFVETGMELFNFLLPIYGHSIGLSASQIGMVMGAFALALMLVRIAMPRLAGLSGEERVFSVSLFAAGAVCLVFPFVTGFGPLLAASFVLGLGFGSCAPLSMALSYNRAPAGRAGEAIGLRQTVNKGIEASVPAAFGFASAVLGLVPVYWFGAMLLGWGGWLMHGEARRRLLSRDS
jgi:MFS family permease